MSIVDNAQRAAPKPSPPPPHQEPTSRPPVESYPIDRYPRYRPPFVPPYSPLYDSTVEMWLKNRYPNYYYSPPQTIVVQQPVAPVTTTTDAKKIDEIHNYDYFASLWPLFLTIASLLLIVILTIILVRFVAQTVYGLIPSKFGNENSLEQKK